MCYASVVLTPGTHRHVATAEHVAKRAAVINSPFKSNQREARGTVGITAVGQSAARVRIQSGEAAAVAYSTCKSEDTSTHHLTFFLCLFFFVAAPFLKQPLSLFAKLSPADVFFAVFLFFFGS